jgi:hypothetical protein
MDATRAIAVLIALGSVFAVMLRGGGSFNGRRASTRVRSATGPNLASMLAVLGIAALVIEAGRLPFLPAEAAPLLAALVVVLVVGTVVAGRVTPVLTALIGVGLLFVTLGPGEAISLAVMAVLLLWLLGALRGWSR